MRSARPSKRSSINLFQARGVFLGGLLGLLVSLLVLHAISIWVATSYALGGGIDSFWEFTSAESTVLNPSQTSWPYVARLVLYGLVVIGILVGGGVWAGNQLGRRLDVYSAARHQGKHPKQVRR